jgi:hypothetical protein
MPVARVTLQRTLVRGTQCSNNQQNTQYSHQVNHESSSDVDLSQAHHRNERLKQKYDHSGSLMYAYGN